jgi:hypothetical protein
LYQPGDGEDTEQGVVDKVCWRQPNCYVIYAVHEQSTICVNYAEVFILL